MICKCRTCNNEYENKREFKTSICDECFKRCNENMLQPLKDRCHKLEVQVENGLIKIKELEKSGRL